MIRLGFTDVICDTGKCELRVTTTLKTDVECALVVNAKNKQSEEEPKPVLNYLIKTKKDKSESKHSFSCRLCNLIKIAILIKEEQLEAMIFSWFTLIRTRTQYHSLSANDSHPKKTI